MECFPVDVRTNPRFSDSFDPRPGGHRGTDIFAPRGSVVLAVEEGDARTEQDPKGGTVIYLQAKSGAKYYYAHLDTLIDRFPRHVYEGDGIGTVGTTGNAQGTDPHLHFQMWLPSLGLVNPYHELERVAALDHDADEVSEGNEEEGDGLSETGRGLLIAALLLAWGLWWALT